uniref:RRM domain-containing protein n=2 Tax=Opuntia streptacantha TaxID=393608 RepID=A0A7C8ZS15_OPUST
MAFCSRVGSILKQSISQSSASSMMNSIRCMSSMSSTKLFVGGLSFGTDDGSLKDAFSSFGEVVDAKVITDRDTGRSRGFGFVNFTDSESASSAMSAMDGQELNGRSIRVTFANERPSRPQFGGGGYGGDRGFGGGF